MPYKQYCFATMPADRAGAEVEICPYPEEMKQTRCLK